MHIRLCCISRPRPPTKLATIHLHCSLSASLLTVTTIQKECVSLCNGKLIPNLLWYWPKSTTERTVQMYCSDMGGWLWWADATESYMQGPRTSKCCKLNVQTFCCCSVYWNTLYTRRVTYGQSFLIFPISSNINLQQMALKYTPAMTSRLI